jgi:probable HAF family extracellular repeat protein
MQTNTAQVKASSLVGVATKPTNKKPNMKEPNYMKTKQRLSTILGTIALVAGLALGVSGAPPPTYTVTDLGVADGMNISEPAAINIQGHVAGTMSGDKGKCAFLYRDGKMQDLGGVDSRGFGISASGLVVGDAMFEGPYGLVSHAALFKGGTIRDLGALKDGISLKEGIYSRANGINAFEVVVGFSGPKCDIADSRAFVWTAFTGMLDIGTLGGPYAQAQAINDAGFVTGTSQLANGLIGATHAFLYQIPPPNSERYETPMLDLQTLGGVSSYGLAVNAYNHVVGYSEISMTDNRIHAFFYRGGKSARAMIDLGSLGVGTRDGDYSAALGINSTDQVVGYSYLAAGDGMPIKQAAFVYNVGDPSSKGMRNLNQLIGKASVQYWLISANAINDKGQIVAYALDQESGTYRAVLLTPDYSWGPR